MMGGGGEFLELAQAKLPQAVVLRGLIVVWVAHGGH